MRFGCGREEFITVPDYKEVISDLRLDHEGSIKVGVVVIKLTALKDGFRDFFYNLNSIFECSPFWHTT